MGSIITLSIVQSIRTWFYLCTGRTGIIYILQYFKHCGSFDRWMFYIGMCRLCIGDACRSSDIGIICSDGSRCLLRFCDRFLTDKNGDSVHFGGNHRKYRIVYN